tara:strand:- start:3239 stop:4147 length:909 start_codon:yes stop_codon:yes gene_type:complete
MILITGAAGFIGSCLVNNLIENNKIIGIDDLSTGHKSNIIKHKNYKFIKGDCGNKSILKRIKNVDTIFHLAGQSSGEKSFENPQLDFLKNTKSTVNILEHANKIKCKHFIYASSMSIYGDKYKIKVNEKLKPSPISFYGISKECSEKYIEKFREKNVNYTILRFFNVYGSKQKLGELKQGMIRIYLTQILKNKSLIVKGNKNRFRDFIHINDVLKILIYMIGKKKFYNKKFNIGTGKKTKIDNLIKLIKKKIDYNFSIKYQKGTKDDQFGVVADISKLKKFININKFISIDEGLDEMINNIK